MPFAGPSAVSDAGVYAHYLIESNFKTSELRGGARGLDVFLNLLRALHVACNASIKQLNDPSSPVFKGSNAWSVWIDRWLKSCPRSDCQSRLARALSSCHWFCWFGNSKLVYRPNIGAMPSHRRRLPMPSVKSCAPCAEWFKSDRGIERPFVRRA